jgi:small subunit ribosomal protein S20
LANIQSAIKNIRQSERRRAHNRVFRSRARTFVKKARLQIAAGELQEAQVTTQMAIKALDKAAQKNIIHKNNAARSKSRLMHLLNQALETKNAE